MKKSLNGFSLIEVLVFLPIIGFFFITATSIVTVSLRNLKTNQNKILASHFARQLEEWLRVEKEINWGGNRFSSVCIGGAGNCNFTENTTMFSDYCFNTQTISSWGTPGICPSFGLNSVFKRDLSLSTAATTYISQVNATITVSWQEAGRDQSVKTQTSFSILEK